MGDIYDKVNELAKRRGFVWPTSECYGSVAGFIDYGPLGAMLKRKVENIWRDFYVIREGYYEIECPTIGAEAIYLASGHVGGFADKMCQCPHCNEYHRADHIAEAYGTKNADMLTAIQLTGVLEGLPCPTCGEPLKDITVFHFNLMFETSIGPGSQRKGYLRPETAQGIFTDFNRLTRFYREKLPFGAVQIGKSYRNEISPRQGMIRLREFTQAEAEIFVHPEHKDHPHFSYYARRTVPLKGIKQQEEDKEPLSCTMKDAVESKLVANEYVAYYIALTHDFLIRCGINPEKIRFRQHLPDERAHYAEDCWDAEIYSERFGWVKSEQKREYALCRIWVLSDHSSEVRQKQSQMLLLHQNRVKTVRKLSLTVKPYLFHQISMKSAGRLWKYVVKKSDRMLLSHHMVLTA